MNTVTITTEQSSVPTDSTWRQRRGWLISAIAHGGVLLLLAVAVGQRVHQPSIDPPPYAPNLVTQPVVHEPKKIAPTTEKPTLNQPVFDPVVEELSSVTVDNLDETDSPIDPADASEQLASVNVTENPTPSPADGVTELSQID